jgi:hypothetical protein
LVAPPELSLARNADLELIHHFGDVFAISARVLSENHPHRLSTLASLQIMRIVREG